MGDDDAAQALDPVSHSVTDALRAYGATYSQVARAFAAYAGLHSTDAAAMIEILGAEERGTPLSPARLSDQIGLSFGATSTLLNRLEAVGHVTRSRTQADRRVVTLHSTPEVQRLADEFFAPLGRRLDTMLAGHSPAFLAEFSAVLMAMRDATDEYISEGPGSENASAGRHD
ncbi:MULTISPECIES: MarR family winged helix-turn-helix transcriptional regulator [Microbacterium]|uniref:MarR family winged helix-turn-helix transcriptional regulator n=1 Tax=Microbacterium TaxID=33882 RepID=UPI002787B5DB|nr:MULTISPECIES: MarR family winged helix-turn-helix transcriptional regulator [Microbacterium]MDQ1082606.1 DNA-binding MarR family transcriptional regulator [Microbacterium sp. SORGH_AS_0344]MDQ1168622.1 DNA-binding MarR family transcriptional regulator [Microbacterium proteolyticum]